MNLSSFHILLTVGLLTMACQPTNRSPEVAALKAARVDTIAITEDRLMKGLSIKPTQVPIAEEDAAGTSGSTAFTYKVDTLATTEHAYALLVGRLYTEESIGWLVTIDRTSHEQLNKCVVYYNNAEGMTQTEGKWLPAEQRVVIETGTYDEAGQYNRAHTSYQVSPDGTLVQR
jgi:hypothetical protein